MTKPSLQICLLGRFALSADGRELGVNPASERVLAFLSLHDTVHRDTVAWTLWQDRPEDMALHCLRSALWRLPKPAGRSLVEAHRCELRLSRDVDLDVHRSRRTALALLDTDVSPTEVSEAEIARWAVDLLPAWYDDWLMVERERYRQLRLHALERLSERSTRAGHPARAIELALQVVDADPLRETAHRCIVRAHLAEGNIAAARGQLLTYLSILRDANLDAAVSTSMAAELHAAGVVVLAQGGPP